MQGKSQGKSQGKLSYNYHNNVPCKGNGPAHVHIREWVLCASDVITCYYNASEGTASREADMAKRQRLWEKYTKLKDQIPSIKV